MINKSMILDKKNAKKSDRPDEACVQMAALIGQELLPKTEPRIATQLP